MLEKKPNCGVKASPNIIFRCKTLKAKFLAIQELRGLSGAGWDDVKKMVDINDTSYAEYVETHSHCAKLNRVPFPCYDGLEVVFGKSRTTGKEAVGPEDLNQPCPPIKVPGRLLLAWKEQGTDGVDEQPNPSAEQQQQEQNGNPDDVDEEPNHTTPSNKGTQSKATQSKPTHTKANSRRKRIRRTRNDDDDNIAELKPVIEKTVASLESMLDEAGAVNQQRAMLVKELKKYPALPQIKCSMRR
ncbi:hypothetical protein LINPERHAP1_LOCUS98 [Linum perenne]